LRAGEPDSGDRLRRFLQALQRGGRLISLLSQNPTLSRWWRWSLRRALLGDSWPASRASWTA
jgi:hypothetical protein